MHNIIDISVPLSPNLPVWPGDQKVVISKAYDMQKGDEANLTSVCLSSHTGTHIDAPLHFVNNGKTTIDIPLEKLVGECLVVDLSGRASITAHDLDQCNIPVGTRKLLIKTDNSSLWVSPSHPFKEDYCALTADAAQWVVDHQIELIGIDYLSIQLYTDPADTHVILLSNEVVILETLDLRTVSPGNYRLICLPLKIQGVEGVPVRAVLER